MTKGEHRVGIDFNPSGDETVAKIKRAAADLIDATDAIDNPGGGEEVGRCKAEAQTCFETGAMWAVKAATKKAQEPGNQPDKPEPKGA